MVAGRMGDPTSKAVNWHQGPEYSNLQRATGDLVDIFEEHGLGGSQVNNACLMAFASLA